MVHQYLLWAREALASEAAAIGEVSAGLGADFVRTAEAILACRGRVIVMGMGKSGHIGRKIAATLASTGTPAFFVHPAEAAHGDLGMIVDGDVVVALSNSGESDEILAILPALKRKDTVLIGVSSRSQSSLARFADIHIQAAVSHEAQPCAYFQHHGGVGAGRCVGDCVAQSAAVYFGRFCVEPSCGELGAAFAAHGGRFDALGGGVACSGGANAAEIGDCYHERKRLGDAGGGGRFRLPERRADGWGFAPFV